MADPVTIDDLVRVLAAGKSAGKEWIKIFGAAVLSASIAVGAGALAMSNEVTRLNEKVSSIERVLARTAPSDVRHEVLLLKTALNGQLNSLDRRLKVLEP